MGASEIDSALRSARDSMEPEVAPARRVPASVAVGLGLLGLVLGGMMVYVAITATAVPETADVRDRSVTNGQTPAEAAPPPADGEARAVGADLPETPEATTDEVPVDPEVARREPRAGHPPVTQQVDAEQRRTEQELLRTLGGSEGVFQDVLAPRVTVEPEPVSCECAPGRQIIVTCRVHTQSRARRGDRTSRRECEDRRVETALRRTDRNDGPRRRHAARSCGDPVPRFW